MMNSNFVLQTAHPLIKSEQTYVLDRKLISIHSVDRDYIKWPNSNQFGIDLGENFYNIQSMRLINFAIPVNHYTFSDSYQNTKLSFKYSLNYPIYLTHFDPASDHLVSFEVLFSILSALFDWNSGAGSFDNLPSDVKIQYYNTSGTPAWTNIVLSTFAASPLVAPTGNEGNYRLVWTPSQFTITIPEGSYSPDNLCTTIQTLMNEAVYNACSISNHSPSTGGAYDFLPGPNSPTTTTPITLTDVSGVAEPAINSASKWVSSRGIGIQPFIVHYNDVTNKVLFGCKQGTFTLNCGKQEIYESNCNTSKVVFNQYTKWGLAAYLGFQKKDYVATQTNLSGDLTGGSGAFQSNVQGGINLPFETSPWLTGCAATLDISGDVAYNPVDPTGGAPNGTWTGVPGFAAVVGKMVLGNTDTDTTIKNLVSSVNAEYNLDVHGEDALYMEIDKYNNIDEMYPYSERTGNLYNNDLGHRSNGSFARIPLTHLPFGQELGSRNNFVLNVFHTDPPIKKIDRLRFTFRYHDGRLVDFKNLPFSFTLEFNMLKDEQVLGRNVRVPTLYNL